MTTGITLGLDIGTSRTKVVGLDEDGRVLFSEVRTTPWTAQTGAAPVLNPDRLLAVVTALIHQAALRVGGRSVLGLGITSIAETGFLCTEDLTPISPGHAWYDPHGTNAAALYAQDFPADHFPATTGLPLSPTPSIFKLKELGLARRPGLVWLNVAEWVACKFGAAPHAERSLASRTGLLDISTGRPSAEHLKWVGLGDLVPPLVWGGDPIGEVSEEIPELVGVPLVLGGHDHLCAALGAGATGLADVLNSFGTAEAMIGSADVEVRPAELLRLHDEGVQSGFHVLRNRRSLIVGSAIGSHLAARLAEFGGDLNAVEVGEPDWEAFAEESSVEGREADGPELWARTLFKAQVESMRMLAKLERVMPRIDRVVGTGGWLTSDWITELKILQIRGFVKSPEIETAARGAALLARPTP